MFRYDEDDDMSCAGWSGHLPLPQGNRLPLRRGRPKRPRVRLWQQRHQRTQRPASLRLLVPPPSFAFPLGIQWDFEFELFFTAASFCLGRGRRQLRGVLRSERANPYVGPKNGPGECELRHRRVWEIMSAHDVWLTFPYLLLPPLPPGHVNLGKGKRTRGVGGGPPPLPLWGHHVHLGRRQP